jgi:hypothetical protein
MSLHEKVAGSAGTPPHPMLVRLITDVPNAAKQAEKTHPAHDGTSIAPRQ